MYEFKEFEGEDKWLRFMELKEKMHKIAVAEYLQPKYCEADAKGETRALIELSKIIELKDGSILTKKILKNMRKKITKKLIQHTKANS